MSRRGSRCVSERSRGQRETSVSAGRISWNHSEIARAMNSNELWPTGGSIAFHVRGVNEASTLICVHSPMPGRVHSIGLSLFLSLSLSQIQRYRPYRVIATVLYRSRALCQRQSYDPLLNKMTAVLLTLRPLDIMKNVSSAGEEDLNSKVEARNLVVSLIIGEREGYYRGDRYRGHVREGRCFTFYELSIDTRRKLSMN